MDKKKVLYVTQELNPYTELSEMSEIARRIPHFAASEGFDFRVLMPKFGIINERRHRLHEVVRLSGMNIIVDDEDYPLIIKVASLPSSRLQVYFLDNDEFFKRKHVFHDDENQSFADNQERLVFFCKGVMETVKKFGWAPDIIHIHGQITSLIPLYVKKAYKNDPVFQDAKIIYSSYSNDLGSNFDDKFLQIAAINDLTAEDISDYVVDGKINLDHGALKLSEAVISGNEMSNDFVLEKGNEFGLKVLTSEGEIDDQAKATVEFYKNLFEE